MKYRLLGRTGLRVSEIGFGCGNIGGLLVRAPLEEQAAAVTRAMDLGINYFDTAPVYGNGESEKNLGLVLDTLKRNVIVATKVRINREDLTDIRGTIRKSLENSLRRLKRDSVDLLQLHVTVAGGSPSAPSKGIDVSYILGKNGVADAFDLLRSEGLLRFTGFTGIGDTDSLHELVHSRRFDVIQVYYNLLNPSAGFSMPAGFESQDFRCLIDRAAEQGMGVAVIRVLAGGALGGEAARSGYAAPVIDLTLVPGNDYHSDLDRAKKLDFLKEGAAASLSQAGIRLALGKTGISTVMVGFSSLQQVEEAAECSRLGPLPGATAARLQKLWADNFKTD